MFAQRFIWFVHKLCHVVIAVSDHIPEPRRLCPWNCGRHQRHIGSALVMDSDHIAVIELVDMVCAQNNDQVGVELANQTPVTIDRAGVAFVPAAFFIALIWREQVQAATAAIEIPRSPICEIDVQAGCLKLLDHPNI